MNADLPFSVCLLSGSALLFAIMTHVVPFRSFLLTTLHVCQGRRERKKKKREAEVQQFWRLDAGCKLHCCSTHSWTELLFFFSPQQHAAPALPHRVLRFKRSSAYAGGKKKKKKHRHAALRSSSPSLARNFLSFLLFSLVSTPKPASLLYALFSRRAAPHSHLQLQHGASTATQCASYAGGDSRTAAAHPHFQPRQLRVSHRHHRAR